MDWQAQLISLYLFVCKHYQRHLVGYSGRMTNCIVDVESTKGTKMKYPLKIKSALIVIGVLLTGCVVQVNATATKSTPTKTAITQTLAYNQKIHWHPCQGHKKFLCSSIPVPLSYSDSNKGLINIPILIHKANIKSKGTIFFNFGGPGVPSFKSFRVAYKRSLSNELKDNFDLVTFNPRGVAPNAITCHTNKPEVVKKIANQIQLLDGTQPKGAARIYDLVTQIHKLCDYGKISKYTATTNTVKDMDRIRQALQLNKIDYIGYSYGTRVGLSYLLTYPKHSDDFIFDGNVFPTNSYRNRVQGLTENRETSVLTFFDFCTRARFNCPLYHDRAHAILSKSDMVRRLKSLLQEASRHGIPTSQKYQQQKFTTPMLYDVMRTAGTSSNWSKLAIALNTAIVNNNADGLMQLFIDQGYDLKTKSLKYITTNYASPYDVVCVDYNMPSYFYKKSAWVDRFLKSHNMYPLDYPLYDSSRCIGAFRSTPSLPSTGELSSSTAKVLLIGNTYDPRTSFSSTLAVSKYLDKLHIANHVLQWRGVGHTYITNGPKAGCIPNQVNKFLLSGKLPSKKLCVDGWVNPFVKKVE